MGLEGRLRTPVPHRGDDTDEMTEPDEDSALPPRPRRPLPAGVRGGAAPEPDWGGVFAAAPAPLLLLTPDLVVLHASDEWLAATGTTPQRALGRPLSDVLPLTDDAAD